MFETALVTRLSPITANLYPLKAPLDYATPCAIYNRVGGSPEQVLDGDTEWSSLSLRIDVYDPSLTVAHSLARNIRTNLRAWSDDDVQSVMSGQEIHMIDETTEKTLYRVSITYSVFCRD